MQHVLLVQMLKALVSVELRLRVRSEAKMPDAVIIRPEPLSGSFRKLLASELPMFREHLQRLDKESRRLRFAHGVSDCFIDDYALRAGDNGSIIYGYFEGSILRAVAELRKLGDAWGHEAEAAFSVEQTHQGRGIGNRLMGLVIRTARNRGVQMLYMSCHADNARIQSIAKNHDAELKFEYGEVLGEIVPDCPNYFSIMAEALEDRVGYILAVLDLQARLVKAA
jgi:GNAT superfamily N-acetyltransferase